jgi:hypothetical protein
MKQIMTFLIFICSVSCAFCQWSGKADFERETWNAFKRAKLYVVLPGGEEIDSALKTSVEKFWTFNKYEFVDMDKYNELKKSPANFFLTLIKLARTKNYYEQDYMYLFLMKGSKNGKPQYNDPLADLQLTGSEDISSGEYVIPTTQMPVLIKYIQWYANLVTSGKISSSGDLKRMVNESSPKIKSKPLYVLDSDLNKKIKSEADIKKEYPGQVHVVTEGELEEIIAADSDVHLFFCVKSDSKAWDYVYNVKTGQLLYYGSNVISSAWPAGMIPYHYKDWK